LHALTGAAIALLIAASSSAAAERHWVGAWAAPQQVPEPANALPADALADATLRQAVRVTAGGPEVRIRISNVFGTAPLRVGGAHIARERAPGSGAIVAGSDQAVRFDGRSEITVPVGAEYLSDPVELTVKPLERLTVSLYFPDAPPGQTGHPGSRSASFYARGNHLADAELRGATRVEHWVQLSGVDVAAGPEAQAIVTFGDSITDGHGVQPDTDQRWPDLLAERLQADPRTRGLSVLNVGIGGNRLLLDGLGPNALARFGRDVLDQTGVRYVIVLEGVNDLGTATREAPIPTQAHARLVADMIGVYRQMIARAHAHGLKVIGASILPYMGGDYYHPTAENEADRQALNAWIRAPGHFDAVVDFDAALRDPAHPDRMRPEFDSGDHLHPSAAGYRAMAAAVAVSLFAK
jgi:lysophospholipase L1-like esterase